MDLKENLHEDNFEDFIKNKIEQFDELPSSDMWNRIEGVIPPKPKPAIMRYFTPVSIAASLTLVLTLWAAVYQFQSKNELLSRKLDEASQQIETLNQKVEELNANTEELTKTTLTENQAKPSIEIVEKTTVNLPSISNKTLKTAANNVAVRTMDNSSTQNDNSSQLQSMDNEKTSQPMAVQVEREAEVINPKENISEYSSNQENKTTESQKNTKQASKDEKIFASIDFLKSKDLLELSENSTMNYAPLASKPQTPNQSTVRTPDLSNWSLTLYGGPLWARSIQRPKPGSPPSDIRKPEEMSELGRSIGLRVNYQINDHWAVSAGYSRQSEVVNLNIHQKVPYNRGGELPFDPEFTISNHSFQANCNYGEMGINVDFFKDINNTIADGEPLDIELKGVHSKKSFSIPVIAQYQINPKDRWTVGLKGGFSGQFVLKNDFTPVQVEVSEEGMIAQGVSLTTSPTLSERANVDVVAGAQILYKLSDHFQLNVEPTLVWSLTDTHRSPRGNTKSGYGSAQLGLTYLF